MPSNIHPRSSAFICGSIFFAPLRLCAFAFGLVCLSLSTLPTAPARAGEVRVAVASNFAGTLKKISTEFTKSTGNTVAASPGSTGKFFAQIQTGAAPFDLFLSADDERPRLIEEAALAEPGTRFTYAVGRLVLWSPEPKTSTAGGAALRDAAVRHISIASPKAAPYGLAAQQVLRKLGVWDALAPKIVMGENIAQAMQFVETGAADLGFIALAQWRALPEDKRGSMWLIPADLHTPIRQDAVTLKGAGPEARLFAEFLRSPAIRKLIEAEGYEMPAPPATAPKEKNP